MASPYGLADAVNLQTEIAVAVAMMLEADGYLNQGTRWKDAGLVPKMAAVIEGRLTATREEFARFCIWWADISHHDHKPDATSAPFAPRDFWHCQQPMCLSLVGTIHDLARDLKTDPAKLNDELAHETPPIA